MLLASRIRLSCLRSPAPLRNKKLFYTTIATEKLLNPTQQTHSNQENSKKQSQTYSNNEDEYLSEGFLEEMDKTLGSSNQEVSTEELSTVDADNEITNTEVIENSEKVKVLDKTINTKNLSYLPLESPVSQPEPPQLSHNLSRVLFEPNVYHELQDKRSKVYNFSPFLRKVTNIHRFDFNKVKGFIPSGRDPVLLQLSDKVNKEKKYEDKIKFYSSTSSMTGLLSQLHFTLTHKKKPKFDGFSEAIKSLPKKRFDFGYGAQTAAVVYVKLRKKGKTNIYSIDADASANGDNVLSLLGHEMEVLMTTKRKDFLSKFLISRRKSDEEKEEKEKEEKKPLKIKEEVVKVKEEERTIEDEPKVLEDSYHYAKIGKFLLRSQLDCKDKRLPNTGTFDLKSRAVCAIRADMDYIQNTQLNKSGYQIHSKYGLFESYEREKFDLIRSALLKYSFQARIGNMDGIYVCYHNIEKIFGFEYIPLTDIDELYHYDTNLTQITEDTSTEEISAHYNKSINQEKSMCTFVAENQFKISLKIIEEIIELIQDKYLKEESDCFRLVLKAKGDLKESRINLFVLFVPLNEKQAKLVEKKDESAEQITLGKRLARKKLIPQLPFRNAENDKNIQVKLQLNPKFHKAYSAIKRRRFENLAIETSSHVKGFVVSFDQLFNGVVQPLKCYPPSQDVNWETKYTVEELSHIEAKSAYTKIMKEKGTLQWGKFTTHYAQLLREFDKIGRMREQNMESEEKEKFTVWHSDWEENRIEFFNSKKEGPEK